MFISQSKLQFEFQFTPVPFLTLPLLSPNWKEHMSAFHPQTYLEAKETPLILMYVDHVQYLYALLQELLQQLPLNKKWTQGRRDRWLQAFTASVDLLIDVEVED